MGTCPLSAPALSLKGEGTYLIQVYHCLVLPSQSIAHGSQGSSMYIEEGLVRSLQEKCYHIKEAVS